MSFNICFTFALSKSGTNLILFKMSIESKAKPILHSSPAGTGCSTRPLNSMSDNFSWNLTFVLIRRALNLIFSLIFRSSLDKMSTDGSEVKTEMFQK